MRFVAMVPFLLCMMATIAGCRAPRCDLVEAELRTKERILRETKEELERSRLINEALEREFSHRQQPFLSPSASSSVLAPKDIVLANGTGGVDEDGIPGDEALLLVVVPRDEDGYPIRALGVLSVVAWEILPGGAKVPLSSWEINTTDLRKSWKSGLLGSGYHVLLHWKKLPTQERLRVGVQFKLPDGRLYEADKDIPIHPLKFVSPMPPSNSLPLPMEAGPALSPAAQMLLPRPSISNSVP